jgi:branched-subunit amino acid ABC-type transport system permease component
VTIRLETIVIGLVTGMGVGALAMGLVLVYRASRVINLAHAEVGAAAAAVAAWLVRDQNVPYWVAAVVAVAAAGLAGAFVEAVVIRRLRTAPRVVVMVATVGVTELLLAAGIAVINATSHRGGGYPSPATGSVHVGSVVLQGPELVLLGTVPVLAVLVAAWLRLTAVGTAVRAASENRDAAQLAGVPVDRVVTLVWAVAAAMSAVVSLILLAGKPLVGTESLGPHLLFQALAAAVLARFTSLPRALAGGLLIGLVQQVVFYNWPGGLADVVLFGLVLVALLVQHRGRPRTDEASSWLFSGARRLGSGSRSPWSAPVVGAVCLVAFALLSRLATNARTLSYTEIAAYAMLAVSTSLLAGVAGHVSLGQVAFFGLGAAVSYQLAVSVGWPFWLALVGAGVIAALASMIVGLPSLRVPGLLFAVTTLGFALAAQGWLLAQPWMVGSGVLAPRPILGPVDLAGQRAYFVFALVVLALVAWVTRNLLRSGPGRQIVAVRDNEATAAAFAVPLVRTKLLAFAAAGFIAGVAGAVYGHGLQNFSVNDFPVANPGLQAGAIDSLRIVAIAVIGGLGSIPGAIAAAALIVGVNQLTDSVALQLLTSSVGLLVLLLVLPGGLASLPGPLRDLAARAFGGRSRFSR